MNKDWLRISLLQHFLVTKFGVWFFLSMSTTFGHMHIRNDLFKVRLDVFFYSEFSTLVYRSSSRIFHIFIWELWHNMNGIFLRRLVSSLIFGSSYLGVKNSVFMLMNRRLLTNSSFRGFPVVGSVISIETFLGWFFFYFGITSVFPHFKELFLLFIYLLFQ